MQNMPEAVQKKAKLQEELWNYLENKSQYGHENFGKLTRNAATQILKKSPEQFLTELLNIQFTEGEKFWYGSSFPIIRGIGVVPFFAKKGVEMGIKALPIIANILKSLFGKSKGTLESAFGIAIPAHLEPSLIGPDIEKDFGFKYEGAEFKAETNPIKKETTLVDKILDITQFDTPERLPTPPDDLPERTQPPERKEAEKSDNSPLLIGAALVAAYVAFK